MSAEYFAHAVPGLEQIAADEIRREITDARIASIERDFDKRTGLVIFRTTAPPPELLELRTVEDVFVIAAERGGIPSGRAGPAAIRAAIAGSPLLQPAVSAAFSVRPRRKARPTYRVIARKSGEHAFRRVDLQHAAERGILDVFSSWRLVEDIAQLEIWATLIGGRLVAGIRLSDADMRQRTYRRVELPAALKPTVAAAMVLLSRPRPDDVILDPMCGTGTILIERALAARYRLLLGGDNDPEAVRATRENVGPRHKPIEIQQWDARSLPLEDGAVTAIVCNLPFGRQIGSTEENRALYPALLAEWRRVLRPGGRMVLLSSERSLLERALRGHEELRIAGTIPVIVRGMRATIFVIQSQSYTTPIRGV